VPANDLQAQIVRLATDQTKTVDEISAAIHLLFERGGIPPEVAATIQSAYAELLRASGDESYWRWCGIWNR
jgi:phosphoenolpyruvate synthase/pyruvate phosphate dikinase